MSRTKNILGFVMCLVVVAGMVMAQPQQRGGRQGGRQGGDQAGRGNFDPAQMQQMMADRMKESLKIDEKAWPIVGPRLMKVMELNRNSGMGRMMGMMGRGGRGGPGGDRGGRPGREGQPAREVTPTQKITEELRTMLDQDKPDPAQIKEKLTALRSAREKDKAALATAQQKLREVLTLPQEARCILSGLLE